MGVRKENTIDIRSRAQLYSLRLERLKSPTQDLQCLVGEMVRIAIAGGSGSGFTTGLMMPDLQCTNGSADVAQEIVDVLVAAKKHEILLLSRKVRIMSAHVWNAGSLQLNFLHRMLQRAQLPRV